ncbi:MAG: ATP-binding protein [Turicibacter sp.]|nr:ATP-binding protein [Turicibacter sp.]
MKIHSFYATTSTGLTIAPVKFKNPALLVGLSGAGKSQLLSYLNETYLLMCGHLEPDLPDGEFGMEFSHEEKNYRFLATVEGHVPTMALLYLNGELVPPETLMSLPDKPYLFFAKNTMEIRQDIGFLQKVPPPGQLEEIRNIYCYIFEDVTDVHFDRLCFKQGQWLYPGQMSDGMLKTFAYLKELISAPSGSVLLIDEFENGLGPNCLGVLLEEMLARDDVQLILSSHHPYVINNIPPNNWLITSRKNNLVKTKTAAEMGIGQTRYDAFFELQNGLHQGEDS